MNISKKEFIPTKSEYAKAGGKQAEAEPDITKEKELEKICLIRQEHAHYA